MNVSFRTASAPELMTALQDARRDTLALIETFLAAGFGAGVQLAARPEFNPPLWELGHVAWFAEWYVLREAQSSDPTAAHRTSMLTKGDDWFDPNTVSHRMRWKLELPSAGALKTYCHEVLDRVLDKLSRAGGNDDALYPYRLVLAYEDMRRELMLEQLQTLGIAFPRELPVRAAPNWAQGEISFPGGTIQLGSAPGNGFVFDNEKWAHACRVPAFTMDSTLVSNAQFAEFVADGGYQNPQFWSVGGRAWLMLQDRSAPRDWVRDGRHWLCDRFGQHIVLPGHEPVRHLSLYEAQAYCVWADCRLPSEAEWEYAAMSGHPALRWGDLWEWTCSPFEPYPGFAPDAYREYSEPHFISHQSVRGASVMTQQRMHSLKFRRFCLPERDTMFIGFRTCVL